jgi:hypothetical protein
VGLKALLAWRVWTVGILGKQYLPCRSVAPVSGQSLYKQEEGTQEGFALLSPLGTTVSLFSFRPLGDTRLSLSAK